MTLELSLACQGTDRTRPLLDGRVKIDGCRVNYMGGGAEEIFQRAFRHGEFDVSELSLSSHLMATSRGDSQYIGIPAFVSRSFRHSAIYVHANSGIVAPADLREKKVGVPDFQQTAGVWVRGFLADEFGVQTRDVQWLTGGMEKTGRLTRIPLKLPPDISVTPIAPSQTLSSMLASGEIDALISPRAPSCFGADTHIRRLFPDYRLQEEAYFQRTGLFPIMHLIGIRRSLVKDHPWLAMNVYKAFVEARAIALAELAIVDTLRVMHPWIVHEIAGVKELMGNKYWSYGIEENRSDMAAILRYAKNDGLIHGDVRLDDVFASATFDDFNF